jgi:hypothetical protein
MAVNIIPDSIRDFISYDPQTGLLHRLKSHARWKAGEPVGHVLQNGYVSITHKGRRYYAHRIAWFLAHGEQPDVIDHINHKTSDNRLCNLRNVTKRENILHQKRKIWHISPAKREGHWAIRIYGYGTTRKTFGEAWAFVEMYKIKSHPIGLPSP